MCEKGPVGMSDLRSVQRRRKRVNPITGAYVDGSGGGSGAGAGGESAVSIGQVDLVSSTKLRALVRRLETMRDEDPTFKALVFSQFTSFLGEFLPPVQSPTVGSEICTGWLMLRSYRGYADQGWYTLAVSTHTARPCAIASQKCQMSS